MIYLAKMNLVEDDLIGMADSPEPCDKRQNRDYDQSEPIIPFH